MKKHEKDLRKSPLEMHRFNDLKQVQFSSGMEHKDVEMKASSATRLLL
jgi:hypothetical protein